VRGEGQPAVQASCLNTFDLAPRYWLYVSAMGSFLSMKIRAGGKEQECVREICSSVLPQEIGFQAPIKLVVFDPGRFMIASPKP
jgi:hypothetical protein